MIKSFILNSITLCLIGVSSAFDPNSKQNVALYWGQNSGGTQQSLGSYCQSSDADIYLLSFLYQFPTIGLNFANACYDTFSDGILHCSQIAEDIKTCQSLGKKVFLSMGGASGAYGFASDEAAKDFAQVLWNTFGEGSADERPFDDAIIDGFDLDIENNNPAGYAALVTELRTLFATGSKQYYISAAPQCPYPDASVGSAMQNADIDFAFIQFYNNYCNVDKQFNWDTWVEYAQSVSPNKNIKLYLGLPGSPTAAGSGYISDLSVVESTIKQISSSEYFGGVAMWDASQAFSNQVNGQSYVANIKSILEDDTSGNSEGSSSTSSSLVQAIGSTSTGSKSTGSTPSTVLIASSGTSTKTTLVSSTTIVATPTTTTLASSIATSSAVLVSSSSQSSTFSSTSAPRPSTAASSPPTSTQGGKTTLAPAVSAQATSPASPTSATTKTLSPSVSTSTTDSAAHSTALQLNAQFAAGKYNGESTCTSGDIACSSDGAFAICNFGSWVHMACAAGTTCYAYDTGSAVSIGCNYSDLKPNYS